MSKARIAVVRGGPSAEYDVSMITGRGVLDALGRLGYQASDVTVTKNGEWLERGRLRNPQQILSAVDVVFIAMHGAYGEDGTIQRICEDLYIPFTGSNSFPSKIAFNKDATKKALLETGIKLPKHLRVTEESLPFLDLTIASIAKSFGPKYVVKPTASGSSHGVVMVDDVSLLKQIILERLTTEAECMIEERIIGTETTCGILEDFRDEKHYILPPIEIVPPPESDFFDYEVKYNGKTNEICPARLSYDIRQKVGDVAMIAHKTLGLSQYSRTDMIIRDNEVYFLEVNTLPGLTPESLLPKAAAAVGLSYDQLIDHLIKTAKVR